MEKDVEQNKSVEGVKEKMKGRPKSHKKVYREGWICGRRCQKRTLKSRAIKKDSTTSDDVQDVLDEGSAGGFRSSYANPTWRQDASDGGLELKDSSKADTGSWRINDASI